MACQPTIRMGGHNNARGAGILRLNSTIVGYRHDMSNNIT